MPQPRQIVHKAEEHGYSRVCLRNDINSCYIEVTSAVSKENHEVLVFFFVRIMEVYMGESNIES